MAITDPNTGRPLGDHGTAQDAIDYALECVFDESVSYFLRGWREGDLSDWPKYYAWLRENGR